MKGKSFITILFAAVLLISCEPSTNKSDLMRLLSPAMLPYLKPSKHILVSSVDSLGGNNDRISLAPGQHATILNVSGPGVINRIWFTLDSRDPNYLRKILVRMYWDDEASPSVDVPLGDFFGCGFSYKPYVSLYLGMTSGGFVCYFPMPFEKSARMEIINETDQEVYSFYYQIDYQSIEGYLDRSVAYFHALWNRDIRTNYDSNYTVLKTTGQGHVVGVNLNIQSYDGSLDFLEGNEMVYTDGEIKPSIVGTGTEDFFSGGWYFSQGEFAGPYHGLIMKDDSLGRIAAYRMYVNDPIPFKKSIAFTIEHGQGNTVEADYSSTVFYYLIEPHHPFRPMPKAGMRIPLRVVTPVTLLQAESLVQDIRGIRTEVVDVSKFGPDWSEGRHFLIHTGPGDQFTLSLTRLLDPVYTVDIYYSQGPDYGNVRVYDGDRFVGGFSGYNPTIRAGGKITVPGLKATHGQIALRFETDGKNTLSKGYLTALDGINLIPERNFITDWFILGPFPNPKVSERFRIGLDSIYPPETYADTSVEYAGVGGKQIHWRYVQIPSSGYFSLKDEVFPNELVVSYALAWIWSETERNMLLMVGTDDGAKVFFNDQLVYRHLGLRIALPDQVSIPVHMNRGWNKLMMKVENNLGGYGFYARFIDPDKTLVTSARKLLPKEK
jgi:hypothetical protein